MLNPYRSHSSNHRPTSKTPTSNHKDLPKIKQYVSKVLDRKRAKDKEKENQNDVSKSLDKKEGLLGSHKVYEMMTRDELIQKLLTTEQLLKRLYKENKQLKDLLKQ